MSYLVKKSVVFDLTTAEGRQAFDQHRLSFYEDYLWEAMEEAREQVRLRWGNSDDWEKELLNF